MQSPIIMPYVLKLSKKQYGKLVQHAFPEYHGRKVSIEFVDHITFHDTNWSGGTKNTYVVVASDGKTAKLDAPAPWINHVEGKTVDMPQDALVLCHQMFCGQDAGIMIYAHKSHLPKWIEGGHDAV